MNSQSKKDKEPNNCVMPAASSLKLQTKLTIGPAADPSEQEADMMADRVTNLQSQPNTQTITSCGIQRKCAACEEEDKLQKKPLTSFIQRKESASAARAFEAISDKIITKQGSGQAMDNDTRNFMESGFNTDFSAVKIHTDNDSVQMNRELGARAFTVGSDIYFNEGQYLPNSSDGKHLLAHELTHTLQQGSMRSLPQTSVQRKPAAVRKKTLWLHVGFDSSAVADTATMKRLRASIAAVKSAIAHCCSDEHKACDVQVKTLYDWNRNNKPAPTDRDYDGDTAADITLRDKNVGKINTGKRGGVRLLVTGSSLSQTWQGVRIGASANAGADNLIWNVNVAPDVTVAHETGHIAGYSGGDIEGGVHNSEPDNLMSRGDIRNAGAVPDVEWCEKLAALAK